MRVDEVDYKIFGTEMQYVEIELDPQESVVAEAGAMMYKDAAVQMETVFGDGSAERRGGGLFDKLMGAGKRLLTGESLFMTVFTLQGRGKGRAAFAAPYPGNIIPVNLAQQGGAIICQKDSFLCAARGVSIGIFFQKKILTGLFGGEGFILQKLSGSGVALCEFDGHVKEYDLAPGQSIVVDTGYLAAMDATCSMEIQTVPGAKNMIFGGEGLFNTVITGPGRVYLQSMPISGVASALLPYLPSKD